MATGGSKESKPYKLTFEHRKGYLYAYACGREDSFEISVGYWKEIAEYCRKNKFSKLLFEEDFETDTSFSQKHELVSRAHEEGFTGIKIAFVDRHPEQMESNLFAETVAKNWGILVKVFSDLKEAEKWLLS